MYRAFWEKDGLRKKNRRDVQGEGRSPLVSCVFSERGCTESIIIVIIRGRGAHKVQECLMAKIMGLLGEGRSSKEK